MSTSRKPPMNWKYSNGRFEPYDDTAQEGRKEYTLFAEGHFSEEVQFFYLKGDDTPKYRAELSLDSITYEFVYFDTQADLLEFLRDYLPILEKLVHIDAQEKSETDDERGKADYDEQRELVAEFSHAVCETVANSLKDKKEEAARKKAEANKPSVADEEIPDDIWEGI